MTDPHVTRGPKPMLLPPAAGVCQECAWDHPPEFPHDAGSLFYGSKFMLDHNRQPTWADAMAHCTDEMRAEWTTKLVELGADIGTVMGGPVWIEEDEPS